MSRTQLSLVLGAAISLASFPAAAQERVELFTAVGAHAHVVELDATVSGFGTLRHVTPLAPGVRPYVADVSSPIALTGGRYLVWPGEGRGSIAVFDRRTRATFSATLSGIIGYPVILTPDRFRPRVFVNTSIEVGGNDKVWVFDARTGASRLLLETSGSYVTGLAHAGTADWLFVATTPAYLNESLGFAVIAVDVGSGTVVRRFARPLFYNDLLVNDDGSVFWSLQSGFGYARVDVVRTDTGASIANSGLVRRHMTLDAARGLVVVVDPAQEFLVALDAYTLTERWRSRLDLPLVVQGHRPENQPLSGRWMTGAYDVHVENRSGDAICQAIDLVAVAPDGIRRATTNVFGALGHTGAWCSAYGVLVRSPFAPHALAATVTGRAVSLAWQDPGDTTDFTVDVGFAPGQRAITAPLAPGSTAVFTNVPPGTYYVRVTGRNEVGTSPASNEVRVVVP